MYFALSGETVIPATAPSSRLRGIVAVIASMVIVNLVYGLTLPLLSLVLDARGISKTVIGLSIFAQASAGVVLSPFMPGIITRTGAGRVMRRATVLAAVTLVVLGLLPNVYAWFPLRFLLGAAAAFLWSASEAVVNEMVPDDRRGRVIGVYGSAGAAGFAMGPLILIATGTEGFLPFAVTACFIVLAGLPLLALDDGVDAGSDSGRQAGGLWRIFRLVPYILLLNLTYAATVEAFIAFFPLFGVDIGMGTTRSLSLLTTFAIGGVVLQLPLGVLADKVDRHRLLLACLLGTMLGFLLLPSVVSAGFAGAVFTFVLGGIEGMIYALGLILLGQRFRGPDLATASVLYTAMWAGGMMLGPPLVGAGMDIFGDRSLPWLVAGIYAAYLPVFLFRRRETT